MPTTTTPPPETHDVRSKRAECHLDEVADLARRAGWPLQDFQAHIVRTYFGPEPECCVVLPKGNAKSSLAGLLIVHHLLTIERPHVVLVAGSREQAEPTYDAACYVADAAGEGHLIRRLRALRRNDGAGGLIIVASDGKKAHGPSPSLSVVDELWCHRGPAAYVAQRAALVKRPGARMLTISTPAGVMDSPLGAIRARALAGTVTRTGVMTEAHTRGLSYLEWSLEPDADLEDDDLLQQVNPASWITREALAETREALPRPLFAQFNAGVWGSGDGAWLPAGAWTACQGHVDAPDGCEVVVAVDVGGERASTAVVAVTRDLHVARVSLFTGDAAVLDATDEVLALSHRYTVREIAFDPWRWMGEAKRLERDHGAPVVKFDQSNSRMTAASEALHGAIVERRLVHDGHEGLARHIAASVAKRTPGGRGWRLEQASHDRPIDAAVALAMAVHRVQQLAEPRRFTWHGWLD